MKAKDIVTKNLKGKPILVDDYEVEISFLDHDTAGGVSELYRGAYNRGDWFGDNYADPEETVFNPEWMARINENPSYSWFVFTQDGEVLGSTMLKEDKGVVSIDETQLNPERGRKLGIMTTYFRRFVPLLHENGLSISTYFVLTKESYSLRQVLIGELGMVPIGIHPNSLVSRPTGIKRSEISAVLHPFPLSPKAVLAAEAIDLYNIIKDYAGLPEPYMLRVPSKDSPYEDHRIYLEEEVDGTDPIRQKMLYDSGYRPVAYNPVSNRLTMAKFPRDDLGELSFIYNEGIEANKRLLDYLYSITGEISDL